MKKHFKNKKGQAQFLKIGLSYVRWVVGGAVAIMGFNFLDSAGEVVEDLTPVWQGIPIIVFVILFFMMFMMMMRRK